VFAPHFPRQLGTHCPPARSIAAVDKRYALKANSVQAQQVDFTLGRPAGDRYTSRDARHLGQHRGCSASHSGIDQPPMPPLLPATGIHRHTLRRHPLEEKKTTKTPPVKWERAPLWSPLPPFGVYSCCVQAPYRNCEKTLRLQKRNTYRATVRLNVQIDLNPDRCWAWSPRLSEGDM
jgi:hypothetical protein